MSDADRADSHTARSSAPVAAIVAPVLAFGATFLARKVLSSAYRGLTGSSVPDYRDEKASLSSIIAWAAVSGATIAVVEALIFRNTARFFDD